MERKNYSFYMLEDFDQKIEKLRQSDDRIQSLSRSQALYFIISELARCGEYKCDLKPEQENS